jgi:hypothetical protein
MKEQYRFGLPSIYNLRKVGNDYYEYGSVDKYTGSHCNIVPLSPMNSVFKREP